MADLSGTLHVLSEKFLAKNIHYALIGGFALHAAGYMRATGDIDLLVNADDVLQLKAVLLEMGYKVVHEDDNVLHFEAPWSLAGGIDVLLARRKYTVAMLKNAVTGPQGLPAVRPEDIIGLKVQAMANDPSRRLRDMADIEWLLRAHSGTMDMPLVREYFSVFDMLGVLDEIRRGIPDA